LDREQSAGGFYEAEVDNVVNDTACVGVEIHDAHFGGNPAVVRDGLFHGKGSALFDLGDAFFEVRIRHDSEGLLEFGHGKFLVRAVKQSISLINEGGKFRNLAFRIGLDALKGCRCFGTNLACGWAKGGGCFDGGSVVLLTEPSLQRRRTPTLVMFNPSTATSPGV
jgi:hypothetical protein